MIIGICDDDRIWCKKAEEILWQFTEQKKMDADIYCFTGRTQMEKYSGEPLDVLFLDIEFPDESGIQLANWVNEKWNKCQIAYLTNYLNYAMDVYHTEHVYFVVKEQFESRIDEIFRKILHQREQSKKKLVFQCRGGNTIVLAPEEIYYFERHGRTTYIKTDKAIYEIRDKLEQILLKIPDYDFVRCHNSYIVYLPAIKENSKDEFIMKNGETIVISRGYAKATREAFAKWVRMQMI